MPISIYETRSMMQVIERMFKPTTFLRDTFFRGLVVTTPNEHIDVDMKIGKRKLAPFVARKLNGFNVDRLGFKTNTYTVPKIAPQMVMTKDNIIVRSFGETLYSEKTPEQRAAELLGRDLADLNDRITRTEEDQCRQLILTGKIVMHGFIDQSDKEWVDEEVDYGFNQFYTPTGSAMWNSGSADIHGDLKKYRLAVLQKSGRNPDLVVMSSDVVEMFLKDPEIQKIYHVNRFNLGDLAPAIVADGLTRVTYIQDLGLDVYSYDAWYEDPTTGIEQPILPPGTVIIGRRNMGRTIYGSVTQLEMMSNEFVTYEGQRVPRNWVDTNGEAKMVRISSRPLPAPETVYDWYVLQVA